MIEPLIHLASIVDRQTSAADLILSAGVPSVIAVALFGALASPEFVANGRRSRPLAIICLLAALIMSMVAFNGMRPILSDAMASRGVGGLLWPHVLFFLLVLLVLGAFVFGLIKVFKTPVEEFGPIAKWYAIPVAVATTAMGWRHVINMGDTLYVNAENVGSRMSILHYAAFFGPLFVCVVMLVWGLIASRRNMSEI